MAWWLSSLILFFPVFLSGLLVFNLKFTEKRLKLILSFSGAYILALVILHLLPELYEKQNFNSVGLFILCGFFIQLLLEFFSTGIEHGHAHFHGASSKIPFAVFAGLFIHSMLEGMPITQQSNGRVSDGLLSFSDSLVVGIVLHNIPISIAFTGMLLHAGFSRQKAIVYLIAFAAMAPLGCMITAFLNKMNFTGFDNFLTISLAIVVGIFLHISTTIMFESSEKNHRYQLSKIVAIVLGTAVAWLLSGAA
jgi:zinc and cadmium transporter